MRPEYSKQLHPLNNMTGSGTMLLQQNAEFKMCCVTPSPKA
jgi:hypothetical protein